MELKGRLAYYKHGHAHRWCGSCTEENCEVGPCCDINDAPMPKTHHVIYDHPATDQYLLMRSELAEIIETVVKEAKDSWSWGEGMDIEVLWLKLDRDILQYNKTEVWNENW